jgi:hypothetical protein
MKTTEGDIFHIRRQVDRIVLCLFGSGKTGLTTRVTVLEAATKKHGRHWSSLIEMILRDIIIVVIMWLILRS